MFDKIVLFIYNTMVSISAWSIGGVINASDISAQQKAQKEGTWVQKKNENQKRQKGACRKEKKRQEAFVRII